MKKEEYVQSLHLLLNPVVESATAKAPVNIALAKYWGKRDEDLNLPVTDSLSLSLQAYTTTTITQGKKDEFFLSGKPLPPDSLFFKRLQKFLDLFRPDSSFFFSVHTTNDLPTQAGLASSASGFAATVLALDQFFNWNLSKKELSCLARLGSGSACRSIYPGFVKWQKGVLDNGSDSFATPLPFLWKELRLGLKLISDKQKPISSKEAMKRTLETSPLYPVWPKLVDTCIETLEASIQEKDFLRFGKAVEDNAKIMHATMQTAFPPILYFLPETIQTMHTIYKAREDGLMLFFTMDAGPNVKVLYLEKDKDRVHEVFPKLIDLEILWT